MFGIGQYGANFLQGTRDRSREMRGERQRIAEAFNAFRQQNPEASYSDFRTFVDNMSDGSNYLRGAMPADEVLRELDNQNEINRRTAAQERANAALTAQQQGQQNIRSMLEQQYRTGNRDINGVLDTMIDAYGYDPSNPEDAPRILEITNEVRGLNPDALFNEWDRATMAEQLRSYNEALEAGLVPSDADGIANYVPEWLRNTEAGNNLQASLENRRATFIRARERELGARALDQALTLAETGADTQSIMGIVTDLAEDPEFSNLPMESITRITDQVTARLAEERNRATMLEDFNIEASIGEVRSSIIGNEALLSMIAQDENTARDYISSQVRLRLGFLQMSPQEEAQLTDVLLSAARDHASVLQQSSGARSSQQINEALTTGYQTNVENVDTLLDSAEGIGNPNAVLAIRSISASGTVVQPSFIGQMVTDEALEDMSVTEVQDYLMTNYPQAFIDQQQQREQLERAAGVGEFQRREDWLEAATTEHAEVMREYNGNLQTISGLTDNAQRMREARNLANNLQFALNALNQQEEDAMTQRWALANSDMSSADFQRSAVRQINSTRAVLESLLEMTQRLLQETATAGSGNRGTPQAAQPRQTPRSTTPNYSVQRLAGQPTGRPNFSNQRPAEPRGPAPSPRPRNPQDIFSLPSADNPLQPSGRSGPLRAAPQDGVEEWWRGGN